MDQSLQQTERSGVPGPCAIIVSRYNESITTKLLEGAQSAYLGRGGNASDLSIIEAPGAYELGVLGAAAARSGSYESVVCLGCVIKGETEHDRHIARSIAHTLSDSAAQTGVPISFGVLTTNNAAQARARAAGAGGSSLDPDSSNKGEEAMLAALETASQIKLLEKGHQPGLVSMTGLVLPDKAASSATEGGR